MLITNLDQLAKTIRRETEKEKTSRKLTWETEAERVIKDKIDHYDKTGNTRKLAIYKAKLADKQMIITKLQSLMDVFK